MISESKQESNYITLCEPKYTLSYNRGNGYIIFNGEIRDKLAIQLIDIISIISETKSEINLYIYSSGGDVYITDIFRILLQQLRSKRKINLITYAIGNCSSSAITLFFEGDTRYVYPGTFFGFHMANISGNCNSKDIQKIGSHFEREYVRQIISRGKVSIEEVERWIVNDITLSAEEMIEYDLAIKYDTKLKSDSLTNIQLDLLEKRFYPRYERNVKQIIRYFLPITIGIIGGIAIAPILNNSTTFIKKFFNR